jgi:hypothetical protein
MIKQIEVAFEIEDVVYVKTDDKQLPRIVQGYWVGKKDVRYQVALNETTTYFYEFELSKEKGFLANKSKVGFNK